jgi:probable phosphoglycerate mutase
MSRLYLVRHGETEWNKARKIQGGIDTELSAYGVVQAHALAERLANEEIDVIYSSHLQRAMKTAEIIASYKKCNILESDACHEIRLGPWEGLTMDEIQEKYSDHLRIYKEDPSNFHLPGAETFLELAERTYNSILGIVSKHSDRNILLVSHGTAIKAAIIRILGIDINHYTKFKIDNASVSIIDFKENDPGKPVIVSLNDTGHLKEASRKDDII